MNGWMDQLEISLNLASVEVEVEVEVEAELGKIDAIRTNLIKFEYI